MPDKQPKHGTTWQDDELDSIVADYFAMLSHELAGEPYVKSQHSAALMEQIGRTHRSVEFKHQNISAVLGELGLPWIAGYKPKENYQNSIFDAVDRYLSLNQSILELVRPQNPNTSHTADVFVSAPIPVPREDTAPPGLRRLVRKFDPAARDFRNRSLGRAGEAFVLEIEKRRLEEIDRLDLACNIRWISSEWGDGAGYDVHSFDECGSERLIEVKTTNGAARTPFFLSRNEIALSNERAEHWCIYRVHLFSTCPRIFSISPPLESSILLRPETWCASF